VKSLDVAALLLALACAAALTAAAWAFVHEVMP
jgi:hypothetical protein